MTHPGTTDSPILVGVDGSDEGWAAIAWAADEARRLRASLHIVHAWVWPMYHVPLGPPPGAPPGAGLRAQAEEVLAHAEELARSTAPDVKVESSLLTGGAAEELLRSARAARMLVVGHRGLGGFAGLLLGSVGVSVVAHAPCSVVVVRGRPTAGGPVAVGVDGSAESNRALVNAFGEAVQRGTHLLAVHAWTLPSGPGGEPGRAYESVLARGERQGRETTLHSIAAVHAAYPEVTVDVHIGDGSPAAELVAASAGAQLVVVGAVGAVGVGGFHGRVLGSTTHALVHHAMCPVFVTRG